MDWAEWGQPLSGSCSQKEELKGRETTHIGTGQRAKKGRRLEERGGWVLHCSLPPGHKQLSGLGTGTYKRKLISPKDRKS